MATRPGGPARAAKLSVWERDGYACTWCGESPPLVPSGVNWKYNDMGNYLTVDHIIPRSKGGTNEQSNLVTMCAACNISKADGAAPGKHRLRKGARLTQRVELVVA